LDGSVTELLEGVSTSGGNLDGLNLQLRKAEIRIRQEQIKIALRANELNEKLLISNEVASQQSELNAEAMNQATKELARSTSSLNRATWVLVAVTAIQALIAVLTFFKK